MAADEEGMRSDFYNALKDTGLPTVRMPGGNFVSGWQWKDSIGPRDQRKTHLDLAWFQYVPNDVGHDEYLRWAEKAESAFGMCNCLPASRVRFAAGTLEDSSLTWWNSNVQILGLDLANAINWEEFKNMMREVECIQKKNASYSHRHGQMVIYF